MKAGATRITKLQSLPKSLSASQAHNAPQPAQAILMQASFPPLSIEGIDPRRPQSWAPRALTPQSPPNAALAAEAKPTSSQTHVNRMTLLGMANGRNGASPRVRIGRARSRRDQPSVALPWECW